MGHLQYICGTLVWLASRASVPQKAYKYPATDVQRAVCGGVNHGSDACRQTPLSLQLARSKPERFAANFFNGNLPDFDVAHGGVGIPALVLCVVLHEEVEHAAFLVHVVDEAHPSAAHHAAALHAIAAGYLLVHVHQFVAFAEADADGRMLLRHVQFASFGTGVQEDGAVFALRSVVGEVHGDNVRIPVQVGKSYGTIRAFAYDAFYLFRVGDTDCLHNLMFCGKVTRLYGKSKCCNICEYIFMIKSFFCYEYFCILLFLLYCDRLLE